MTRPTRYAAALAARCTGRLGALAPARVRALGFVGTALMAASGYLAGALPWSSPQLLAPAPHAPAPPAVTHAVGIVVWFVGVALLAAAWWAGTGRVRDGTLTNRWALATVALWAVPL